MNSASARATTTSAQPPIAVRKAKTRSIARWNSIPAQIPAPAQINAPPASKRTKEKTEAPMAPASGGATVEKPGTNLATRRDGIPHFSKKEVVWRTQESGDSEIRQRVR